MKTQLKMTMDTLSKSYLGTAQRRTEWLLLPLLAGAVFGLFVLFIFEFPTKFIYYFLGGPVILLVAILSGHLKKFFQGVLIFIIPINFAHNFFKRPVTYGGGGGVSLSPLDIVLFLLYMVWLYEIFIEKKGEVSYFPRISIPLFVLAIITLMNTIVSPDPYLSLFEAIETLKSLFLFLYVANHFRSKKGIAYVLIFLLVGLFLQSMISFAQRWMGMPLGLHLFGEHKELGEFALDFYMRTSRVGGTIGHANGLAKYIEQLIPLSVVLLFTTIRLRYKLASVITFVCAFIVLLLTLSRAGWVCFLGSMILIIFLVFRAKFIRMQTVVAILLVSLLFGAVMFGFSDLITSRLFGGDYGSAESRIPASKIAWSIIKENALLGVGVRKYDTVVHLYNPLVRDMHVKLVHNAYLQLAAERGILALVVMLFLQFSSFSLGLRNLKKNETFLVAVNIGFLASVAALWAHWIVDIGGLGRASLTWVIIGLIAATSQVATSRESFQSNVVTSSPR
jgi:O-antigen ligase